MRIRAKHVLIFLIAISFLAAYFFPIVEGDVIDGESIAFVGILFGIIVGFFIADLYSRYQGIRDNAALDASSLSTYYSFAKILGQNKKNKRWLEKQKELINKYIHRFMPLPWPRYSETEPEFSAIVNSLGEIRYDTDKENETYSNMLAVVSGHSDAREKLVMYGKDKLTWGEWLVVLFLALLLVGSLFYVKVDSLVSVIFTGALISAILILLFVLKDLNNLNFGESSVSVEPYERVLDAIGKPRYYRKKGSVWKAFFGRRKK
ncbi:MAG: DUF4239 domain-containing protein [Nanoarchaeota archaeon]|nr:DUF4239 domain-containing protein [Nanoarchaeota archaeon]